MLTILVFIVSLNCVNYDHGYFDSMAEIFSKESGAKVQAVCYGIYDDYVFKDILFFHYIYIKNSGLADTYVYVFMDMKPEDSRTPWGYLSDFEGVAAYSTNAAFVFWKPYDKDSRNLLHGGELYKWYGRNTSVVWHELLHIYYFKLGKSNSCYGQGVHKEYGNRDAWATYHYFPDRAESDLEEYSNKNYLFLLQSKPNC